MKRVNLVIVLVAVFCCFASMATATTTKGLQMANAILNDEQPTKKSTPPMVTYVGETKPTTVSATITDEKIAQLARELKAEKAKRAAEQMELFGKGGTVKRPKGGLIGGLIGGLEAIKNGLKETDEKVAAEQEARKLLEGRVEKNEEDIFQIKKYLKSVNKKATDAQVVAYDAYNQSIGGLVAGGIAVIIAIVAVVAVFRKKKTATV